LNFRAEVPCAKTEEEGDDLSEGFEINVELVKLKRVLFCLWSGVPRRPLSSGLKENSKPEAPGLENSKFGAMVGDSLEW
jgi:hypothetical protein